MTKPEIVARKSIWEGPAQTIEEVTMRLSDGAHVSRAYIRSLPGAVVFALNDRDEVALIETYRAAVDRHLIELPAGKIESGDALACAQRELAEETGLSARDWVDLGTTCGAQGNSDWLCRYFLASDLTQGDQKLEPHETIRLFWLPLETCLDWVLTGRVDNNFTMVGLVKALVHLNRLGPVGP